MDDLFSYAELRQHEKCLNLLTIDCSIWAFAVRSAQSVCDMQTEVLHLQCFCSKICIWPSFTLTYSAMLQSISTLRHSQT